MESIKQREYALTSLQKVVPWFDKVKLRNFAMTLGTRDFRKIEVNII